MALSSKLHRDGRNLSETCIQYTEVKKNALLRKSQVPEALGFRTVAEDASIQPTNTPSDEPEVNQLYA